MAKRKAAPGAQEPWFEAALARLEVVHELEEADLPLERSLAVFEEGVRLSRLLHQRLNEAERKVEILLKDESGAKAPAPFTAGGEPVARAAADSEADAGDADDETEGADGGGQRALF